MTRLSLGDLPSDREFYSEEWKVLREAASNGTLAECFRVETNGEREVLRITLSPDDESASRS